VRGELMASANHFDGFCAAHEAPASDMETTEVMGILNMLSIKPAHREALLVKDVSRSRPRFFINAAGIAAIRQHRPRDIVAPNAPQPLALAPPAPSRSASLQAVPQIVDLTEDDDLAAAVQASFESFQEAHGCPSSTPVGQHSFPTEALAILALDAIPVSEAALRQHVQTLVNSGHPQGTDDMKTAMEEIKGCMQIIQATSIVQATGGAAGSSSGAGGV